MSKKVLLIEDLPVIQNLYSEALRAHGFQVDVANDGKAALEKLKHNSYDFVLVDLLLPNMTGIQFLEKFKSRPKQTKVIVLSDFNEAKTVKRAHELGIKDYLIKAENTPSQLIERLNSYN